MKAEFEAEIGDDVVDRVDVAAQVRWHLRGVIGIVGRRDPLVGCQKRRIASRTVERCLRDPAQKHLEVAAAGFVQAVVEQPEQAAQVAIPGIDQIIGELGQTAERVGELRTDFQGKAGATHAIRNSTGGPSPCHWTECRVCRGIRCI